MSHDDDTTGKFDGFPVFLCLDFSMAIVEDTEKRQQGFLLPPLFSKDRPRITADKR